MYRDSDFPRKRLIEMKRTVLNLTRTVLHLKHQTRRITS